MKYSLLLIAFFCFSTNLLMAQDEADISAIQTTLNYYLDGGTNNDFETLKKAFHSDASMKYIRDGYQEVNAIAFFEKVMKPGPKQNRTTKIEYIEAVGNAAHAKLVIDYGTFSFIDFMNLLKIDGEWKIVSKIFYRQSNE